MSLIKELKQRKVFRVAAVYAVVAWGILQVVDVVSEPLSLPTWFSTVTVLLLAAGFPIALVFSWIFDLGPDGPTREVYSQQSAIGVRGGIEIALLVILIGGIGWLIFRDYAGGERASVTSHGIPVVILMDTYAPRGVYDEDTRRRSGTNADVLSDILDDLPVLIQKEAIGSTWDRESQISKQNPNLVLIHRSAFFHSMNEELGVGYPEDSEDYSEEFRRLYEIADNKLVALMGFLGQATRHTQFLVYSRGTGGGWPDADYRDRWVQEIEGRFPTLQGRVTTIAVPGGTEAGSFRRPEAAALIKERVMELLDFSPTPGD